MALTGFLCSCWRGEQGDTSTPYTLNTGVTGGMWTGTVQSAEVTGAPQSWCAPHSHALLLRFAKHVAQELGWDVLPFLATSLLASAPRACLPPSLGHPSSPQCSASNYPPQKFEAEI